MKLEVEIYVLVAFVGGTSSFYSFSKSLNIKTYSYIRLSFFGIKLSKGGYPIINSNIFIIY